MSSVVGEDIIHYGLYRAFDRRLLASRLITGLPHNFWTDEARLTEIFWLDRLGEDRLAKVIVAYATEHFSLVPSRMRPRNKKEFGESFTGLYFDEEFTMERRDFPGMDFSVYFMMPEKLRSFFKEKSGNTVFNHFNAALVNGIWEIAHDFIFFNFLDKRFQSVVVKGGKFQQTNDYIINGKDDALYYALLNCRHFNFDPTEDEFYISGTLPDDSTQLNLFRQHFKNLHLQGNKNRSQYSNVFLGKPKHLFFDIDCVTSCEL